MLLTSFLKKNPDARKIFGERELIIIQKQLRGVRLTQSEKNRLSRDIRKKMKFIQEFANKDFDFELKKSSEINYITKEMKEHILESEYKNKIKKIYLFGSTATGERRIDSDIDIAIEFDEININEATRFRIKFNYDNKIDVQVYNILPEKIKKEIHKKGKIIYERKN